jgi:hypothetical protein
MFFFVTFSRIPFVARIIHLFFSCFALSLLLEKCFGRTSFMESRDMNILEYVAAGKVLRTDIVYGIA